MANPSTEVMGLRSSQAPSLGLTHRSERDGGAATFLQLGVLTFVVSGSSFDVAVFDLGTSLTEGLDGAPRNTLSCTTASEALAELQQRAAASDFEWQCGGCSAPIYTVQRPIEGVLQCAACGDGGVDFAFHYRHIGDD